MRPLVSKTGCPTHVFDGVEGELLVWPVLMILRRLMTLVDVLFEVLFNDMVAVAPDPVAPVAPDPVAPVAPDPVAPVAPVAVAPFFGCGLC